MISLKRILKKRRLSIGSWITIGNTAVAEIMAKAGFDWLVVDMEHSAITLDIAQQLIQIIELSEIPPLVRVGDNDPSLIKRVMDCGAHGVIVPMVNTKEDAIRAVEAVRYPPCGKRGVGLARAQGYGLEFQRYKKWLKENSIVIVQIEHIEGVNNIEEILSVEGVDAFFVGPYDLSASLGFPGDFDNPQLKVALKKLIEASRKVKIPAGFHVVEPDINYLKKQIETGYSFLAFCFDALFLGSVCNGSITEIKHCIKERAN